MNTSRPTRWETEVIPFTAGDGMRLNLHHVVGDRSATRGPVLLVHGAGVRADIFRPPGQLTVVDALLDDGYDVWLENWRASADVVPTSWDLDQAAVHDHPEAVRTVVAATGADTVKAVVHCQGSSSFALSAVAGLLPEVDVIVSNAVSLHPVVPLGARLKLRRLAPLLAPLLPYVDPGWGDAPPPHLLPRLMVAAVQATHRECGNAVCKMASFAFGSGRPALWSHDELTTATHDWVRSQFGPVPMTFFAQMAESVRRGRLTPLGAVDGLPDDILTAPPATDARFVLLAGETNRCFLPESQVRTYRYLDGHRHGHHRLHVLPRYGQLDVFLGRHASREVFPLILESLAAPAGATRQRRGA
ncbi:alpha/beta fold hydrolase [Modestobacter sp. SSW1-42]|uniref:alpha/beta fold hydrolase n=1 Tax=Modestobacter sp. SSW1-42 TaxID=596372 RepID=UPI0039862ECF